MGSKTSDNPRGRGWTAKWRIKKGLGKVSVIKEGTKGGREVALLCLLKMESRGGGRELGAGDGIAFWGGRAARGLREKEVCGGRWSAKTKI